MSEVGMKAFDYFAWPCTPGDPSSFYIGKISAKSDRIPSAR